MKTEDRFIAGLLFSFLKEGANLNALLEMAQKPFAPLDWGYIFEQLVKEGIASTFFYYAKKYGIREHIPPSIFASLLHYSTTVLAQNMAAIGEARKVLSILKENGIPVIVLKGLFLIEHIYPHPAMRGLTDIDLLIHKEDLSRADECLHILGYQAMDGKPETAIHNPPGYLASLDYFHEQGLAHPIHVHWHLVNTSVPAYMFAPQINLNRVWNRSITARIADTDVRLLCPDHTLLYLCEHALRVGHAFDRLILMCDIILLCKTYQGSIDWVDLWDEAKTLHMERFLFLSLSIVEIFADLPMSGHIRDHFKQSDRLRWGERLFLSIHRRKKRLRGSSYLIYLSMTRNLISTLCFIFRTFFPPAGILLQRRYTPGDIGLSKKGPYYRERISEIMRQAWRIIGVFFKNRS